MKYVTVDEAKQHLYIDFFDDDIMIEGMIDAAEDVVGKCLNIDIDTLKNEEGNIPSAIKHAIKIMVGNLYNSRESVSFNATPFRIPYSFEYLLQPYKNYKKETDISK